MRECASRQARERRHGLTQHCMHPMEDVFMLFFVFLATRHRHRSPLQRHLTISEDMAVSPLSLALPPELWLWLCVVFCKLKELTLVLSLQLLSFVYATWAAPCAPEILHVLLTACVPAPDRSALCSNVLPAHTALCTPLR